MERIELTIGGMSCGHCLHAVSGALSGLEGVTVERVEIGSARVAYDPQRVDPGRIRKAVEEEGYTVAASQPGR